MIKIIAEKYLTTEELIRMKETNGQLKKAYLAYEEEGDEIEAWTRVEIPITAARRILSNKMMELLYVLLERKEYSISELAKNLHRSVPNVYRDLSFLERYGLITYLDKGRKKIPVFLARKIIVEFHMEKNK
ncbi:MAG: ArsR family transcriptional regulator [Infirmifilum sp.]|mgnify:CR=1 FL=1|jgi:predicted transcriptional regulator|uniref:HVO_A0114 family putative DNA-binding protein n=1 Tax=Infirmifilum TaxID=2856573 RepID=UPI00069B9915|nr:ArsR family transcriptional regulator [Infirmifilum uzonense]